MQPAGRFLMIMLLVLSFSACEKEKKLISEEWAGTFETVEILQASFNSPPRSRVITTEGTFIIYGIISGRKGEELTIRTYDNGYRYLCIESRKDCKFVY